MCGTCVPLKIQQYKIRQNEQQKHASFNLAQSFGILTQNSKRFRTEVIILNMIVLYCRRCLHTPLAEMEINLLCQYLRGVTKKDDLKPKLDALQLIFRPPNVLSGYQGFCWFSSRCYFELIAERHHFGGLESENIRTFFLEVVSRGPWMLPNVSRVF